MDKIKDLNRNIYISLPSPSVDPMETATLPGIFTMISGSIDLVWTATKYIKAIILKDKEAEIETAHRLTSLPFSVLGSITCALTFFNQIGAYFHRMKNALSKICIPPCILTRLNILGLFLGVIESFIEIFAISRLKKQLQSFHLNTEEKIQSFLHEKDIGKKKELLCKLIVYLTLDRGIPLSRTVQENLEKIQLSVQHDALLSDETLRLANKTLTLAAKEILIADAENLEKKYLCITPPLHEKIQQVVDRRLPASASKRQRKKVVKEEERKILQVKINKLSRRISPLCTEEIKNALPALLHTAKHGSYQEKKTALMQIKTHLQDAKRQTKKYLLTHAIALVIFSLSAATSLVLMVGCPPLIPTIILLQLGILSTLNYYCHRGIIKQKRWKFSCYDAMPGWMQWISSKVRSQQIKRSA